MPKWTEAQNDAIVSRDCNLLVSAAAGSGKTAVLVERIIRLIIEDKVDIDRMLIVTFTNAAAGEMRERILQALAEEIEKGNSNEQHLRRQITLLNRASITTVHSFCISVVRRNFHLIGIDPTFRIGDSTELKVIIQEVLEEVLESEYEKGNENFISLVESFGGNKNDLKLEELILKIYFFIQSKPKPYEWLRESVYKFSMSKEELEDSDWIKTIKDNIKIELSGAKDLINEALRVANGINGPIEYAESLNSDLNNVYDLENTLYKYDIEEFGKKLSSITHERLKRVSKDVDEALKKEAQKLRDKYKEVIEKSLKAGIFSKGVDKYLAEINYLFPAMDYLYELIQSFSKLYSEKKLEKGILDFNDLEHYTLKILENEEIREEFRKKFDHIFVDEYQDSNIVQETILNQIKRDNNMFFVGDVKQSIYRFRLADPSLFLDKYNSYFRNENSLDKRIDLSQNFRSREEILQGINYIFKNIMSTDLGEVEYDENASLYKGADYEPAVDSPIELNIIEKEVEELENVDEELQEMGDIEVEARIIASKIKEFIKQQTYDAKEKRYKDIIYRDIVILLRATKNWGSVFNEILLMEGIPVYIDDSNGYFDVLEIKVFLNLLNIIDNKRQDLPLLSVMRSSIGGFTTDELIKIRISYKNGSYYDAVEHYINSNNDNLSDKLSKFANTIDYWAEEARYLKLDEFIWKLMIETGYYYYVGAMPGGIQRQANLRILVDRACQFDKTSINGLFNFIRFVDKLKSSSGDMGTAKIIAENENVVRIMSIHKSKGLEFPVVICAGLGKGFNMMDTRDDILLHKDLGLGPKFVDIEKRKYTETLPQIAIKKKMKIESLSEEMRVLYVALTRAKDRLLLYGTVRNISRESKKWCKDSSLYYLSNSKNYLDWICNCLAKHNDGDLIRKMAGFEEIKSSVVSDDKSHWNIKILNRMDIIKQEADNISAEQANRERLKNFIYINPTDLKGEIDRRFEWKYKHPSSIEIPSKMSVSEIKKASFNQIEDITYRIPSLVKMPKFLEGKKPFTQAEKGTIIHFIMQHLRLGDNMDRNFIEQQIDDMIIHELLTEEEAKVIDIDKLVTFYQSDIGMRILASSNVNREKPFVLRKKAVDVIQGIDECDEDVLIQGIIDCYFTEDDGHILVDYKTDYVVDGDEKSIVDKYKVQMLLYKEALERITNKQVKEMFIYSFELGREVRVD
ncbi:helicase-exonuclease AddAB subunit AddA [Brassicibacter mesophilus]|uniref:helicase-exonuclease AddAB subunit AddA n=1 Tax=Brassicibacter mesophilus TaxID=745119 RepID=UPI003D22B428